MPSGPSTPAEQAARPVVIVPIFNAVAHVAACLQSLSRTLGPMDSVLLADDASTDPNMSEVFRQFERTCPAQVRLLRQPRNLGFVGNVNAAMADTADADVVLLNSDTIVTRGWLDRLVECAAGDPRIATITPWSNNAEICSFPEFCAAADVPSSEAAERIARAAASLPQGDELDLPTGVGFAMYLRRRALQTLGDFDAATFGRGYGEENDFCLRAAAHGWRNVHCARAYVAHVGNVSFSALGLRAGGENLARLLARYPDYNARVARFIAADPMRMRREQLAAALARLPR